IFRRPLTTIALTSLKRFTSLRPPRSRVIRAWMARSACLIRPGVGPIERQCPPQTDYIESDRTIPAVRARYSEPENSLLGSVGVGLGSPTLRLGGGTRRRGGLKPWGAPPAPWHRSRATGRVVARAIGPAAGRARVLVLCRRRRSWSGSATAARGPRHQKRRGHHTM